MVTYNNKLKQENNKLLEEEEGPPIHPPIAPTPQIEDFVNISILSAKIQAAGNLLSTSFSTKIVKNFCEQRNMKPQLAISDEVTNFMSLAIGDYMRGVLEHVLKFVDQRVDAHKVKEISFLIYRRIFHIMQQQM